MPDHKETAGLDQTQLRTEMPDRKEHRPSRGQARLWSRLVSLRPRGEDTRGITIFLKEKVI